jgi:hypothetical protein
VEGADGRREALDLFLSDLLDRLLRVGEAVDRTHFVRLVPTFSLLGAAGAEPSIGQAA